MTNFYTADLHVGHRNIIDYCSRPFVDVDEMNIALVERWNDTVAHGDTVYILGDLALGNLDDSLAMVGMMHGRKVLVWGNHDRGFRGSPEKVANSARRYIEGAGLAGALHGTQRLMVGGVGVLASHFPYHDNGDDRYVSHRPVDDGRTWLLHGHVHDRWKVRAEQRMINVGVDVWDYAPVAEDVLAGIIDGKGAV